MFNDIWTLWFSTYCLRKMSSLALKFANASHFLGMTNTCMMRRGLLSKRFTVLLHVLSHMGYKINKA